MRPEHVDTIAKIHADSWMPQEISVKLGTEYLHLFYRNIVESPYSFGYVYVNDHEIIAYATGFYDYHAYNQFVQTKELFRLGMILFKRILVFKIDIADIFNLLNDDKKLRKAKYPHHHLGALALSNEFKSTPIGKEAITAVIQGVVNELASKGYPGCWGLCDFKNMPMRKYLLKLGFEEVDTISFIGKSVVLYEKPFPVPKDSKNAV
jgi:hypothetical protein